MLDVDGDFQAMGRGRVLGDRPNLVVQLGSRLRFDGAQGSGERCRSRDHIRSSTGLDDSYRYDGAAVLAETARIASEALR